MSSSPFTFVDEFALWMSGEIKEDAIDWSSFAKKFKEMKERELDTKRLDEQLPGGKYVGKKYRELWMDHEGRRYLQWMADQEWVGEDQRQIIEACASILGSSALPRHVKKKTRTTNKKRRHIAHTEEEEES